MTRWTPRDSAELYNVPGWSNGYFDISEDGNVCLTSRVTQGASIDLKRLVDDLIRRGLSLPLLLRFPDILRCRIEEHTAAFSAKIEEFGYRGRYQAVMPIKVNQERHVVEELLELGTSVGLGLEAGSKPELLVAIALMSRRPGGLIVCNGYKDVAYIETALLAKRLGLEPLIIVDRFDELKLIVSAAERLGLEPSIGVRCKLSSKGSGRWADSGGDQSKFGLTAHELVAAVELLESRGMLSRLVCQHFHIGSQVTAIRAIKDALGEAVRLFIDLCRMGAPLSYMDVGGGLAVDYDGSRTNFHASKNYTLEEYAADIIYAVGSALDELDLPHPTIISESGRSLVAHQAVLVFNVLGTSRDDDRSSAPPSSPDDEPPVIEELRETLATVTRKNYLEAYHDAVALREDALSLYRHGILGLRDRAKAEQLFWATAHRIQRLLRDEAYVPEDLDVLQRELAETYYCNFSLFQSVPDAWAVKALFPVLPIHRHHETPSRRAILADLTCDSDGRMDEFIGLRDVKKVLELHPLTEEPYFLAIFLVGAYQEILGDLHNLFGDVNAVHINADQRGSYTVKHIIEGDRVQDVLSYVSYDGRRLMESLRQSIERALSHDHMTFEQSAALVRHFEAGLAGYTYLEDHGIAQTLLAALTPPPSLQAVPSGE